MLYNNVRLHHRCASSFLVAVIFRTRLGYSLHMGVRALFVLEAIELVGTSCVGFHRRGRLLISYVCLLASGGGVVSYPAFSLCNSVFEYHLWQAGCFDCHSQECLTDACSNTAMLERVPLSC